MTCGRRDLAFVFLHLEQLLRATSLVLGTTYYGIQALGGVQSLDGAHKGLMALFA